MWRHGHGIAASLCSMAHSDAASKVSWRWRDRREAGILCLSSIRTEVLADGSVVAVTEIVDLWIWSLDIDAAERIRYAQFLSLDERQRADRYVFPILAQRFVAAHGRMREILGAAVGRDPASLVFATNPYGKPELIEDQTHFSLSHSGDLAALAVARFPLGVDIEVIRPVSRDLPERFFSSVERHGLRDLGDETWAAAFFRCWTRKEAVIKALGLGLSFPLEDFDVSFLETDPPRLTRLAGVPTAAQDWQLHHIAVTADCIGAIAADRTGWAVRRR